MREPPGLSYRPDIDGLRAVAVMAVLLFHARIGPFTGGYVGVDVFFVISGYLITRLIGEEIEEQRFSLVRFYERRARRLFPALAAVLTVTTLLAVALLLPHDLVTYGRSLAATAVFGSNILFWNQTDYFNGPADDQPLLHTWSLAVEEQFYILFPLFLIVLRRFGHGPRLVATLVVLVASLALAEFAAWQRPAAAFYLAPMRAWELMLGAVLAMGALPLLRRSGIRELAVGGGLALIVWSCTAYDPDTRFPGLSALPPCLGAALVIYGGSGGHTRIGRLLSWRPVVLVGLISYSLYLWHWPLLVFARQIAIRPLSASESAAALLLSGVLAYLSWRFVERPFRGHHHPLLGRRQLFAASAGAAALALACAGLLVLGRGLPWRLPDEVLQLASATDSGANRFDCFNKGAKAIRNGHLCRLGAKGEPSFVLWGDSHALMLFNTVSEIAEAHGRTGLFASRGGCPPLLGVRSSTGEQARGCQAFNDAVLQEIAKPGGPSTVILTARWPAYAEGSRPGPEAARGAVRLRDSEGTALSPEANRAKFDAALERTISALAAAGKSVVILGPVPEVGWNVPSVLARMAWRGPQFDIRETPAEVAARSAHFTSAVAGLSSGFPLKLVELSGGLCDGGACAVEANGRALYSDEQHLSPDGVERLAPLLDAVIKSLGPVTSDAGNLVPPGAGP